MDVEDIETSPHLNYQIRRRLRIFLRTRQNALHQYHILKCSWNNETKSSSRLLKFLEWEKKTMKGIGTETKPPECHKICTLA